MDIVHSWQEWAVIGIRAGASVLRIGLIGSVIYMVARGCTAIVENVNESEPVPCLVDYVVSEIISGYTASW